MPETELDGQAQEEKPEKIAFVQDLLPIKEIHDGMIETTDGRYVRIYEIEPINFALMRETEQISVITGFASWLKISPFKLHFKVITRQADPEKHIAQVRKDQKNETNDKCRQLAEDYIRMVKNIAAREGITRQFYIILEYSPSDGHRSNDISDIMRYFATVEHNLIGYLRLCGNNLIYGRDPDEQLNEILYTILNRRSAATEPFQERVNRILTDAMTAKDRTFGIDPIPTINSKYFFSPRGIEFKPDYFIMDGTYYTILYITSDGYPGSFIPGWTSSLITSSDGVDLDIHLHREDRGKTIDRVGHRIRLNRSKLSTTQDTSSDFDDISSSINAGYYIKSGIANRNEDLFYLTIFITINAPTITELRTRMTSIIDLMKSHDFEIKRCDYRMAEALEAVLPINKVPAVLYMKAKRNVLTSTAAATYPFTSFEMASNAGIMLGINAHNNSLCTVDLFNTKQNKNANMVILGTSGAGKTYSAQLIMLRMRTRGIQGYIIAPIKGHEFRRACTAIGGQFITIGPGSKDCINIMEIRRTVAPNIGLLDGVDYESDQSMLAAKVQQVMTFLNLLVPDMNYEETQLADDAILNTYKDFGISYDNDSLYLDAEHTKFKTMPILGDLYRHLADNPRTERIAIVLNRYVSGSAASFNGQTNVDLNNKYIVFNLETLTGTMLTVGMMIVLDFVWDAVKSDRTQRKAILIDEIWQLIGSTGNKRAAEFCLDIFKLIRGYGGAAIAATQDMNDFFALEDGRYGKAIINNSKNKIILNLEPDEAESVKDIFRLSAAELDMILKFDKGHALLCSNNTRIHLAIKASRLEGELITTDPAEQARMLREILAKKQASDARRAATSDETE